MTRPGCQTPAVDWDAEIEGFLADGGSSRNPRSVTAVREIGGRRYHFKHSGRSLANDARGLRLASSIRVPGVATAELTFFDDGRNVLVTELEPGESLFNAMWNDSRCGLPCRRAAADWEEIVARLAGWLAGFHGASVASASCGIASAEGCIERLRESFRSKLATVAGSRASPLSPIERDRLRAYLETGLRPDLWRDQPIVYLHGDFAPANILLRDDGSLRVLDFGDGRAGFALEDVARLWSGVWELAESGRRRRELFAPACERVIEAYGLPKGAQRSRFFEVLRSWNALTQLSVACSSRARYGLTTRWIHRRLTAAQLRWLRQTVLA